MSDCHDLFKKFYKEINLKEKDNLKKARDAIRNKIKNYFQNELKKKKPRFYIQGSYAMNTIVKPIDKEYDIDDGVYIDDLDLNNLPSPATVHNWIYKAVENHTKEKPIDKNCCIRVKYTGQYHVDLPIYTMANGGYPLLADKSERGWHKSDPKELSDWFQDNIKQKGEQLRRIVQYSKAWSDYQAKKDRKFTNGLILTVLCVNHYNSYERDDTSFASTIKSIYDNLQINPIVLNPVDASEKLSDRLSDKQLDNFLAKLSSLLDNANDAIKKEDKETSSKIWHNEFGDRFPIFKDDNNNNTEEVIKTGGPAILGDDARSA